MNIKKKVMVKKSYFWAILAILMIVSFFGYFFYSYTTQKVTRVRIANLTPNSVTITWMSNKKDRGYVLLSDRNDFRNDYQDLFNYKKYEDVRGNGLYYTHFVTIDNLAPEQSYYFRITDGIKVWDLYSTDQNTKWYEITTASNFSFTTKAIPETIPAFPNDAYGFVQSDPQYSIKDAIVFAVANKADESGGFIDNTDSETLATLVDDNGGWMLDKSQFVSSRKDQSYQYIDDKDFIYVYSQIENILMPGSFAIMGQDDAPFETISLEQSNSTENILSLKNFLQASPVKAADLSQNMCCVLTISGKSNKYYDFETPDVCSSCGECFPVGRKLNSGSVLAVEEFKCLAGKTEQEQRDNCESKKITAASVHESASEEASSSKTSSSSFPNGVCNTDLKDSDFNVSTIDRKEFTALANQFGDGNKAKECFNYVVCSAKRDGVNPEMALEVWLHESAASNYKLFPTVEDMGIHCYGGNSKYPAYPCNTTPKKDLAMQIGMFDALPHTTCLSGGSFDPVKWAAGFWTGSACDMAKGQTYIDELELYWSRIAVGNSKFPTWIKDASTAQPNLNCDKTDSNNNGGGGNGGGGGSCKPTQTGGICCALLLQGENKFRLDYDKSKTCAGAFKVGTQYDLHGSTKKINYVVQVNIKDYNSCEGKVMDVACQKQIAVPKGLKATSQPSGINTSNTKCIKIDPKKAIVDDGIIDVPAVLNKPVSILTLESQVYAQEESFVKSIDNGLVSFTKDGLYNIKIGNYTIKNLPVNSDQKYRFYVNKNQSIGYQAGDQLITPNGTNLKITRTADVTRVNVGAGSNLLSFTFGPKVDGKNIKASKFMDYANIEGIKVIYMSYFDKGVWQKGLRARTDGTPGYIGTDFLLKSNTGYLIISNTQLKETSALVLPGLEVATIKNVALAKGWNLISAHGFKTTSALSLSQVIQTQTKGKVTIAQWLNTKGIYDDLRNDKATIYGNDFTLTNDLSYFLYVDRAVTVSNP